jgi:hypothetical protein
MVGNCRGGLITMLGATASATTLSGNDFKISYGPSMQISPAVTLETKQSNGIFLSAWDETNVSTVMTQGQQVFGQIFDQNGNLIGPQIAISAVPNGNYNTQPRIGYSPIRDAFMVVWTDSRNYATTGEDIYGQLINSSGNLVGSPIAISTASTNQQGPAIAYNSLADQYLIVWADSRNASSGSDIYGQLMTSNGVLVGSNFAITTASGNQDRPRVAFDPTNAQYLVVWSDALNATTSGL